MASLAHHLRTMAYQNVWANHRLLGAVAGLSQAEFVAERTSFFPSIKATANHIVTVDWYYIDALEHFARGTVQNTEPDRFFDPEEPFTTAAKLRAAQLTSDRKLVDFCVALTDERLDDKVGVLRRTGVQYETVTRLLSHLFEHQIHHRGQIHAMLSGTSIKPPQLDEFFCANEAHLRAEELSELGYSEELIWKE